jgi:hypothetical protein
MFPFERKIIFPALLFLGNVGSSAACIIAGDWKRGLYWAASAMCIACVTF